MKNWFYSNACLMVVIYMHNSVKVCGPTTMKPSFYKQGLVLFFFGIET